MNVDRIVQQNKSFREALIDILRLKDAVPYAAYPQIIDIAETTLNTNPSSFIVFKQINGKGPIYKLEVCQNTLDVLKQEIVENLPSGWSIEEFCMLLAKGNRLDINIENIED
ncbi:hypothetical protein [Bacillus massiliigorillae]|uniref:hypothetical protein n=1 Tax=Bacillus massiliigorillae TaxID=1243664 RepID=UPI0003A6A68B|nr:hypothetical protein [Bacillus massiliigorillae]